jgi:hypothetical protein
MKRFLTLSVILGVTSFGLVGCGEESKVEEKTTVETPGGSTEVKKETSVNKSGENPPAAAPADAAPSTEAPK